MSDENEVKVGEKIRELREDQALSLDELASRTGISAAVINQIESHMVSPPLGTLIKLARALGVDTGYFFRPEEGRRMNYSLVRHDERKRVSRVASKEGVNYGYEYESLGYDLPDRRMEPFFITLKPSPFEDKGLSAHEGEEFIYVLEGEMEVVLGRHRDVLRPGDSIYYKSATPHRVGAHGDGETKIIAVLITSGE